MERYDSYKDSGVEWIGEIPSHWDKKRFSYSFNVQKGKIPKELTDERYSESLPYLSMNVLRGEEPTEFSNEDGLVVVDENDIGLLWDGSNSGEVIKINQTGILSSTVSHLSLKDKKLSQDFSLYLLKFYEKDFKNNTIGMGIPHVDGDHVKESKILIPPLSEQQKIVSFLDTKTSLIDSLIEKTQRKVDLLKEKRTSLINEVVTKGLNPNVEMKDSGVEWIGEIPSHWEKSKLKHKGVFFSGYSFDSNDFLSEGEIRVLKISNIQNNGISWDDLQFLPESFYNTHQNFIVNKGDLVFVLTRPIISSGIKVCFFNEEYKTLLNQRNSVFRPNESSVIKRFLFYSVRTFSFIEEFKQQLKETNQPNISTEQISNILIFFPPLSEQQQIVEYLDEQIQLIDKTISIEEKRIELLKEYRQSLISEVVTGKRKVVE